MNNHDEIIKSLSRRKSLSPDDQRLLSTARLEKALGLGIAVSDCDLDLLSSYTWRVVGEKRVVRSKLKGQTIYLGRMIMSRVLNTDVTGVVTRSADADNELDYRRPVLKLGEIGSNFDNELKRVQKFDVPTNFKGLYWNELKGRWDIKIILNYKNRSSKDWHTTCPHFGYFVLCTAYRAKKEMQDTLNGDRIDKEHWAAIWGSTFATCKAKWDNWTKRAQFAPMDDREAMAEYIVPTEILELLKERGRAYAETAENRQAHLQDKAARDYEKMIEKDEYGFFAALENINIEPFNYKPENIQPGDDCLETQGCACRYCQQFTGIKKHTDQNGESTWIEDRSEWDGGSHHYEREL